MGELLGRARGRERIVDERFRVAGFTHKTEQIGRASCREKV